MARILFEKLAKKDISKKEEERNSEFYPSMFSLEFRFFTCNAAMICIGQN